MMRAPGAVSGRGADATRTPGPTGPAASVIGGPRWRRDPLWRAVGLLGVEPYRAARAVALGALALGCAVALSAVSAWLIARAAQMPPVLALSVATVAVRTFGIGRGVLRYTERLASHDVALRGMATLRTTLYERLAAGRTATTLGVRRGDLLARLGADVDAVGDVVVRGLLPAAVAAVLGVGTCLAMGAFLPAAGAVLAACLLLAGALAPAVAARTARTTELRAASARSDMAATALGVLDDAGPLAVAGRLDAELDHLRRTDHELAAAVDAGAGPSAAAAATGVLAQGLAVLGALLLGVPAVRSGALAPVELAVIVLTPLAAFEATSALPAAAVQVQRSRAAATRLVALLDAADPTTGDPTTGDRATGDATAGDPTTGDATGTAGAGLLLRARGLACGWPGHPPVVRDLDLDLPPGRAIAVVGPSGTGKTTLLLTIAGLLAPLAGSVRVPGGPIGTLDSFEAARAVLVTTEDAHLFATTVLENLRVARGDVTAEEARQALYRAGLADWLGGLPDGVDTLLGPDGRSVSGGERRRLLLARAALAPARVLLVDEPAEHLDPQTADRLVRDLLTGRLTGPSPEGPRAVVVVTHRLAPLDAADEVLLLGGGRLVARGRHADLLSEVAGYRDSYRQEQEAS